MSKIRFVAYAQVKDHVNELPTLDIKDEIVGAPNARVICNFTYTPGDPPAFAFLLEWYRTEQDASLEENELTTDIPLVRFEPTHPNPNDGEHTGKLHLRLPNVPHDTEFVGKFIICSRGATRMIEISTDTKDITACTPISQRKTSRPNWEEQ